MCAELANGMVPWPWNAVPIGITTAESIHRRARLNFGTLVAQGSWGEEQHEKLRCGRLTARPAAPRS